MNKPTIIFILNPIAGGKKKIDKEQIKRKFEDREVIFLEEMSKREIRIREYVDKGVRDFVVIGGDGTINDIGAILMNSPARMGIIPAGSGNGLARELGIPMNLEKALDVINKGRERKIDVGLLNGMPFFCTAGLGFDALCAYDFARKKHGRGLWNYIKIVFANYFTYKSMKVKLDGEEKTFFSLTFANSGQYGNDAYISPEAIIDDGFLDCAVIKPHPKVRFIGVARALMNKKLSGYRYFENHKFRSCRLTEIPDKRIHLDGESVFLKEDHITVEVQEAALSVIA